MKLFRWRKGIAIDFYRASRNKQIQSDDEFLRGPRKSKFNRSEHRPVKAEAAEVHHAERCNRKAEGIESGRVGESEASDQKGRNTRLALGRDAWAEEGDRYSFSRPQTDQLMDRGSSCVEYATPESLWTGIITFDNIDSSLHHTLREGHRRPL
ncbi:Uncharacterized protein Adt_21389 [Abeliophyllum distichum]|uniref:Uncharacterized protein n=1 Tax=Abeliophyllum distichum TaxID=126358 RepID=A0ABD1SZC3_9LAMI